MIFVLEKGWWSDMDQHWVFSVVGASRHLTATDEVWAQWEEAVGEDGENDTDVVYRLFKPAGSKCRYRTYYRIRLVPEASSLLDVG